jgi:FKBP-type peptidyl-prolyl cis-trans isomerase 2
MVLQKKDFIEIEFTGKVKDNGVFDSNIKEDLAKLNPEAEAKPMIFCLGAGMFLKGIDDFLIGKEIGKYEIELSPENAFGLRVPSLVQMIPIKLFHSQNLNPVPGAVFNFDNRIAKVISVSGGRVMVDFNNPLAGKNVIYEVNVLRKIEDLNEKIKSYMNFVFRREFSFSVDEKNKKLVIEAEKGVSKFVEMLKGKFKEVFDLELEVRQKAEPLANSSESQIKEIEGKSSKETQ